MRTHRKLTSHERDKVAYCYAHGGKQGFNPAGGQVLAEILGTELLDFEASSFCVNVSLAHKAA